MTTKTIITSAVLVFAMSCTKKETVTETPETTTNTTVVKENSSDNAVEKK